MKTQFPALHKSLITFSVSSVLVICLVAVVGITTLVMPNKAIAADDPCSGLTGNQLKDCRASEKSSGSQTGATASQNTDCPKNNTFFLIPPWYEYLPLQRDTNTNRCEVVLNFNKDKPIDFLNSILPIGLAVLDMLLVIAGVVAVGFVIYGGIQYILSQGEPVHTAAALNTIINALIGGVIAMLAVAIVSFIGGRLGG